MRTYQAFWTAAVALLSALTFALAGEELGWWAMSGSAAMLAAMGAVLGLAWVEHESRVRAALVTGAWFGVGGVLLVGLPTAMGPVALLAAVVLGMTCPPIVRRLVALRRQPPTARTVALLSDRELERRWRRTSEQLHRPGTPAGVRLRLVQERELLLDQLELRSPEEFAARLVRAGWRDAGSVVE